MIWIVSFNSIISTKKLTLVKGFYNILIIYRIPIIYQFSKANLYLINMNLRYSGSKSKNLQALIYSINWYMGLSKNASNAIILNTDAAITGLKVIIILLIVNPSISLLYNFILTFKTAVSFLILIFINFVSFSKFILELKCFRIVWIIKYCPNNITKLNRFY